MSIVLWTAVVLTGGAGSVLRFLADGVVQGDRDFPLGTLAVNVSGAVILGLLTGLALGHDEALLAGTAAVGSYTTFSSTAPKRLLAAWISGSASFDSLMHLA